MQPKNLADPRTFEQGMPYPYFAWLQANEPVHWQEPFEGSLQKERVPQRGFWVVTRYSDVQSISRDQRTSVNGHASSPPKYRLTATKRPGIASAMTRAVA